MRKRKNSKKKMKKRRGRFGEDDGFSPGQVVFEMFLGNK
jgi:hypothetical protein